MVAFVVCQLFCNQLFPQSKPPKETGNFKPSNLVELISLDSTFKLDIRYATTNNFIEKKVYDEARAFLQEPAAYALVEANKAFQKKGLALIIYDGYRPWSVTKAFWDATPVAERAFVADPAKGSRHNRGCAVDVSLYKLSTGNPLPMTSAYDAFNESAHPNYTGGTELQRKNRELLISIMQANGFTVFENEWWHFDYKNWTEYRIEDVAFKDIK